MFKRRKSEEHEIDRAADEYLKQLQAKAEPVDVEEWIEEEHVEDPDKEEAEAFTTEVLQKMSMPELWQRAAELGIPKNMKKDELIKRIREAQKEKEEGLSGETNIFDMLEQLRSELKQFERIREGIRTKIESTSKMVPRLEERKEVLEKDIHERLEKVKEITDLIPKLEEKKENLQEYVQQKQEEKELLEKDINEKKVKVDEITDLIPKLERNRKKIQRSILQKQKEISKIDKQIKQILDVHKYGIDLVSTLIYATEKSKQ